MSETGDRKTQTDLSRAGAQQGVWKSRAREVSDYVRLCLLERERKTERFSYMGTCAQSLRQSMCWKICVSLSSPAH